MGIICFRRSCCVLLITKQSEAHLLKTNTQEQFTPLLTTGLNSLRQVVNMGKLYLLGVSTIIIIIIFSSQLYTQLNIEYWVFSVALTKFPSVNELNC